MTKCISVMSFRGIDLRQSQTMPWHSGIIAQTASPRVAELLHKPLTLNIILQMITRITIL